MYVAVRCSHCKSQWIVVVNDTCWSNEGGNMSPAKSHAAEAYTIWSCTTTYLRPLDSPTLQS